MEGAPARHAAGCAAARRAPAARPPAARASAARPPDPAAPAAARSPAPARRAAARPATGRSPRSAPPAPSRRRRSRQTPPPARRPPDPAPDLRRRPGCGDRQSPCLGPELPLHAHASQWIDERACRTFPIVRLPPQGSALSHFMHFVGEGALTLGGGRRRAHRARVQAPEGAALPRRATSANGVGRREGQSPSAQRSESFALEPAVSRVLFRRCRRWWSFLWAGRYRTARATNSGSNRRGPRRRDALANATRSRTGLAPGGVCRAPLVTEGAVRSYRTVSPLPAPCGAGGLFSVALSFESPRLAVSQHPALRSPDFPRRTPEGPAATTCPARARSEKDYISWPTGAPRARRCRPSSDPPSR